MSLAICIAKLFPTHKLSAKLFYLSVPYNFVRFWKVPSENFVGPTWNPQNNFSAEADMGVQPV